MTARPVAGMPRVSTAGELEATFGIEEAQADPRTADVTVQLDPANLAAKVTETFDAEIWQWTAGLISGHTLKHLFAALSGVIVGVENGLQ